MADFEGILLVLSGGASNTNPNASLGGAASQEYTTGGVFTPQTATRGTPISGIGFCGAWGVATGNGTLQFTYGSPSKLEWTPNGGTSSGVYIVTGDGLYGIGGAGSMVLLKITSSALPLANASETIAIDNKQNNLFDNIDYAERTAGDVEYRALFIKNDYLEPIDNVTVEIVTQPTGATFEVAGEYLGTVDPSPSEVIDQQYLSTVSWGSWDFPSPELDLDSTVNSIGAVETGEYRFYGTYYLGANPNVSLAQTSDGATYQLPTEIVDESDSTNLLAGLTWGTSVDWSAAPIGAGEYVSFWLKRTKTADGGSPLYNDALRFRILYDGG